MKVYSHSLQGKRPTNEDQHYHILNINGENAEQNNINLFAVFDGHGGKAVSKFLKENLPQFFVNKFPKNIYTKNDTSAKYFNKVYNLLQNKMKDEHPRFVQYCGSTACVAIQFKDKSNKDKIWILNVGDSRAVKCTKDNKPEQLTTDHKPNEPAEKARIEQMGGKIEYDGYDWRIKDLSLSRAFGDIDCTPFVTHIPQINKYKIRHNDKFIIFACDGLWDVVSNQDAINFVNKLKGDPKYKGNYAKDLAEHAYEKGSLDNITTMVYMLN